MHSKIKGLVHNPLPLEESSTKLRRSLPESNRHALCRWLRGGGRGDFTWTMPCLPALVMGAAGHPVGSMLPGGRSPDESPASARPPVALLLS